MKLPYTNKGGWKVHTDTKVDDYGIFRTRKSLRENPRTATSLELFLIDGLNWANIFAITPNNEIILVRQYRHGIEDFTIELPGGCVEKEEDPKEGVIRELQEETGYITDDAEFLGTLRPNPAMMSNSIHFYLARNVNVSSTTNLDPGENIDVITIPFKKFLQEASAGKILHALNVAGIAMLLLKYPEVRNY